MANLCYLYIESFRVLKEAELVFDPRYAFSWGQDVLSISDRKPAWDGDFYGANIYSLTAIVGKNGAGKSTAIEALMRIVVEGCSVNSDELRYLIVEKIGDRFVFKHNLARAFRVFYNDQPVNQQNRVACGINTFFYSGHFSDEYDKASARFNQWMGSYNASDVFRLKYDLQQYANKDAAHMSFPLRDHLYAYRAQNNYRICRLLADKTLRDAFNGFTLPKYVEIAANQSGATANALSNTGERLNISQPSTPHDKDSHLRFIVYHILVNTLMDSFHDAREAEADQDKQALEEMVQAWVDTKADGNAVEYQFNELVSSYKGKFSRDTIAQRLLNITRFIVWVEKEWNLNEARGLFYIDVETEAEKLERLISEMRKYDNFMVARYFDFYYSQSLSSGTHLSSGEQEMLNLFSRIYDAEVVMPEKIHNVSASSLFIFDEAEIGYHPEWQRRYVSLVIAFLNALFHGKNRKVQVILSSHSPIILSDLPKLCTNFLERTAGKTCNRQEEQEETFAQNIFELYRNSFYMSEGLIGEFAENKMASMKDRLKQSDVNSEKMRALVSIVGDPFLKNYLIKIWEETHRDDAISYYQSRIDALKSQADEGKSSDDDRNH